MPTKISKDENWHAYRFDALSLWGFDNVASVSAGVANTAIQARLPVPTRVKIPKVCVNYSAIASTTGDHLFNIVLGDGSYSTAGAQASGTVTLAGTSNASYTTTITINGTAVQITQGGVSTSADATSLATAIGSNSTVNKFVSASASGSVVTITALANGTYGNAITLSASVSSGSTETATASGATLTGGLNNTVTDGAVPDDTGRYVGALAQANPGGFPPVQVGTNGMALFSQDQSLESAADTPQVFIPTNYDGIIEQGTLLTVRVVTPASVGSITNLKVTLCVVVVDPYGSQPAGYQQQNWSVPQATANTPPGW